MYVSLTTSQQECRHEWHFNKYNERFCSKCHHAETLIWVDIPDGDYN